jgi:hypothetical protein
LYYECKWCKKSIVGMNQNWETWMCIVMALTSSNRTKRDVWINKKKKKLAPNCLCLFPSRMKRNRDGTWHLFARTCCLLACTWKILVGWPTGMYMGPVAAN